MAKYLPYIVGLQLLLGYTLQYVDKVGVLVCVGYFLLAYTLGKTKASKMNQVLLYLVFVASSIALAIHQLPGFSNLLILDKVNTSGLAAPYSLSINYDKFEIIWGVLLLKAKEIVVSSSRPYRVGLVAIGLVILQLLSVPLGLMAFDFTVPEWTLMWAMVNLLITCPAEESFFRGFVQSKLVSVLGEYGAIGTASFLFGIAHFAGGPMFVGFATLAGVGYGLIYHFTGKLTWAVAAHFFFNLTHLVFFTYPVPVN
jgi:uncharacterized protein